MALRLFHRAHIGGVVSAGSTIPTANNLLRSNGHQETFEVYMAKPTCATCPFAYKTATLATQIGAWGLPPTTSAETSAETLKDKSFDGCQRACAMQTGCTLPSLLLGCKIDVLVHLLF